MTKRLVAMSRNNDAYLERVEKIVEMARTRVVQAINVSIVHTYFEVGRIIVEEEQQGKGRAKYGQQILKKISLRLTGRFGKGWGCENLRLMRKLYLTYAAQSPSGVLEIRDRGKIPNGVLDFQGKPYPFQLSWSHYLMLMRIDNPQERRFYEIEAVENGWTLSELKRQFAASLYERLALSRDKKGVMELSRRGQKVEKPEDSDENSTIGILLCADKDDAIVEMTLPRSKRQVFASKYLTVLPDKESLRSLVRKHLEPTEVKPAKKGKSK